MDHSKAVSIDEYYDKLSPSYDELYGAEQLRKHERVAELLGKKSCETLVDVGCGTGHLLETLASRYEFAVGIDISSKMLQEARGRLGLERVGLVRADSKALPVRIASVEFVLAISMLDSSAKECVAQMLELRRILRQDGVLVFSIFHPDDQVVGLERFGFPSRTFVEDLSRMETLCISQADSSARTGTSMEGLSQLL